VREYLLDTKAALFTPSGRTYVSRQVSKEDALALSRRITAGFHSIASIETQLPARQASRQLPERQPRLRLF